jgi:5-methyltetrahydropteroyltriglutamate--homocysteine methyltransferase
VQLDNPDLSAYYSGGGFGVAKPPLDVLEVIAVETAAVDGLDRPDDFRLSLAVDWGQYPTTEADEQVAWEVFDNLPFDRFLIPFQTDDFVEQRLLQFIPKGKAAVLGIVDAAATELEDVDVIIARIERAFELKHPDEIALSPSRGFQDAAYVPARVTVDQQRRILTHVETLARMMYGGEL